MYALRVMQQLRRPNAVADNGVGEAATATVDAQSADNPTRFHNAAIGIRILGNDRAIIVCASL